MPNAPIRPLRYRQIHLDFHTSEHISHVGAAFDPDVFVATLQRAHVDSISLFAKCHHGWSYYPTAVGEAHPNLTRPDLLGDMVRACAAADIETPIYISVQWDERLARLHPEWRAMNAGDHLAPTRPADASAMNQLSATWHTLCLNHEPLRTHLQRQAREVLTRYRTVGLFFDIIQNPDCVCSACLKRMQDNRLDALNPSDRRSNDEAVNAIFRNEMSTMLRSEFPGTRIFYNNGHIDRIGAAHFDAYTHLELESLPTGGWGYNHFPSSARYAAKLGKDFLGQTGKFHTSWGEFGGFKHPQALDYECAFMAALGAKCLVGDQLHPSGRINQDTYDTIEPAYQRLQKLEPYLEGAVQISEIAILSAEYFHRGGLLKQQDSDDGAVQMLLELQRPFDVIDPEMDFSSYRLIILPDVIPIESTFAEKLQAYMAGGGRLLLSGRSGLDPHTSRFAVNTGLRRTGAGIASHPSFTQKAEDFEEPRLPASPFVVYGDADVFENEAAEVLAWIVPSYFNRTFAHFCSHQHAPDAAGAPPSGVAASVFQGIGFVAYPIFSIYRAVGQPLYKYFIDAMIERLMPGRAIVTGLPSAGRATLTHQRAERRTIAHLLYGPPQVRGQAVKVPWKAEPRLMEMIEDIPALGPLTVVVKVTGTPGRVYDALTGEDLPWSRTSDGTIEVAVPSLHVHRAIVFDAVDPCLIRMSSTGP